MRKVVYKLLKVHVKGSVHIVKGRCINVKGGILMQKVVYKLWSSVQNVKGVV